MMFSKNSQNKRVGKMIESLGIISKKGFNYKELEIIKDFIL